MSEAPSAAMPRLASTASWARGEGQLPNSEQQGARPAADAFLTAQPWLHHLDHVAFSGWIKAAKPAPAAFRHCVVAMAAAPTDCLLVDDRAENVSAAQAMRLNEHVFTDHDELSAVIDPWLPTRQPTRQ